MTDVDLMTEPKEGLGIFQKSYEASAQYFVFTCLRDLLVMTPLIFVDTSMFWTPKYRFVIGHVDFLGVMLQSAMAEQIF